MQTAPEVELASLSVPGVIPESVFVHDDAAAAAQRFTATPTADDMIERTASPAYRNAASASVAAEQSTLREHVALL